MEKPGYLGDTFGEGAGSGLNEARLFCERAAHNKHTIPHHITITYNTNTIQ